MSKPKSAKTKYVCTVVVETERRVTKECIKAWLGIGMNTGRWVDEHVAGGTPLVREARVRSIEID